MFTHLHTTEWVFSEELSSKEQKYFINRINGNIIVQYYTKLGYEYYSCTSEQAKAHAVGVYLGCIKNTDKRFPNVLVIDHDKEPERTVSIDDSVYL